MQENQTELKGVFTRIGGALLMFLVAYKVVASPAVGIQELLLSQFPSSVVVYIITDLICSLCYAFAFLFPAFFFYLVSKKVKTQPIQLSLRLSKGIPLVSILAIMFLGRAVCQTFSFINAILFPVSEGASGVVNSSATTSYELVLLFISTAIIPAFVEEMLFRGVVLSNLRPYSESGAIIVSALAFGLMHQTPYQILYATAVGIVLGIIYVKTESLWPGILVHFFNNFFAVVQTYLLDILNERQGTVVFYILSLSVIFLGLIFGAIFSCAATKKKKSSTPHWGVYGEGANEMVKSETTATAFVKAFFAPTMLLYVVLCVATIVLMSVILWIA